MAESLRGQTGVDTDYTDKWFTIWGPGEGKTTDGETGATVDARQGSNDATRGSEAEWQRIFPFFLGQRHTQQIDEASDSR